MAQRQHPPTYALDDGLPPLHLPKPDETVARLKRSLSALVSVGTSGAAFDRVTRLCDEFVADSNVQEAQKMLEERGASRGNWLDDWWLDVYLSLRDPLQLSTNIFAFNYEPTPLPVGGWKTSNVAAESQRRAIQSATFMVVSTRALRDALRAEAIPPSTVRKRGPNGETSVVPISMHQLRSYYSTRIPMRGRDLMHVVHPKEVRYALLMYRGTIGTIAYERHYHGGRSEPLTIGEIKLCLEYFVQHAPQVPENERIGTLTAAHRDVFADAWKALEEHSEQNRLNLQKIVRSGSTVAIDSDVEVGTDYDSQITHSCFGSIDNRWYDKPTVCIITPTGGIMTNCDHAPMDAIVGASLAFDTMTDLGIQAMKEGSTAVSTGFDPKQVVDFLKFNVPASVKQAIRETVVMHTREVKKCHVGVFFTRVASKNVLKQARLPPDPTMQMALQLAVSRDRMQCGLASSAAEACVPVYETASTREMFEGRTETIKSLTLEQRAFVESMITDGVATTPEITRKQQVLLQKALSRHLQLTMECSAGQGVDRHLLGLKLALMKAGRPLPRLLGDPALQEAATYTLSTSQMIGRHFIGGFVNMMPDSYGACYYVRSNTIDAIVSTQVESGKLELQRYKSQIEQALTDILKLVAERSQPASHI